MLQVHMHGRPGQPTVIVLHGGPAAVGAAAPIARGLADMFRVVEPWQRGSGTEPLTVARHVADLHAVVEAHDDGAGLAAAGARSSGADASPGSLATRPALVGESWGAMLALAYAAAHPTGAGAIVLIGCGTFDRASRARLRATLAARIDDGLRRRIARLQRDVPDASARLAKTYELSAPLYDFDPIDTDGRHDTDVPFDGRAHDETWTDMVRLQEEGVYPAAFAAIESPVLMLHGAYDPHPGRMIRASLARYIPALEYREWERCGHRPWRERAVRDEFFAVLRGWLARQLRRDGD